MAADLTVACVYRPGGGFSDEYVYRLRDTVKRNCRVDHRFVCLTNQKLKNVETRPLLKNWPGYWAKLELFRSGLFEGRVFYLDLDTVLLNDCTDIMSAEYEFACGTSWKPSADGDKYVASAVMGWNGYLDLSHVYERFKPSVIPDYEQSWKRWGDQGWLQDNLERPFESLLNLWPERIVHTKTHIWGSTKNHMAVPPAKASIVAFSGRPRPHQLPPESPLYKAWVN